MRKTTRLQQGGVYTPVIAPYRASPIDIIQGPNIPTDDITAARQASGYQLAQLQQKQQAAQYKKEQDEARKAALVQKNYFDLKDKLFGDVHSVYQENKLKELKTKHGISEDISTDVLDNPLEMKDLETNLLMATTSSTFNEVMGQVEEANKVRDRARTMLNDEEYEQWSVEWDAYQVSEEPFDINRLAPSKFKKKPETKTNFTPDLRAIGSDFAKFDPTKQADKDQVYDIMAQRFAGKDGTGEAAKKSGYIEDDGLGGYRLTDEGKKFVDQEWSRGIAASEGKLDEWYEKKNYSEKLRDENYQQAEADSDADAANKTSTSGGGGAKETEAQAKLRREVTIFENESGGIDPNHMLKNGLTVRDAIAKGMTDKNLSTVKKNIIAEVGKPKTPGKTPSKTVPDTSGNLLNFGLPGASPAEKF